MFFGGGIVKLKVSKCLAAAVFVIAVATGTNNVLAEQRWQKDVPDYKEAKVNIMAKGPTLIFSDSPEMVKDIGIMYRDTVSGDSRIFFHHVNDTKSNKRIAVVIKNVDSSPAVVSIGQEGISEPDYDYLKAGKDAQINYFTPQEKKTRVLRTNHYFELINTLGIVTKPGQLVTGMIDFSSRKKVEVTALMLPVEMSLEEALAKLPVLAPDEGNVLRGTFSLADRQVIMDKTYDGKDVWGVLLADNDEDPYARGIDATTGQDVVNYGNYGIVYGFSYAIENKGRTEIRLNPWGGLFAGAGRVIDGKSDNLVFLPQKETAFGITGKETIVVTSLDGANLGTILFSPPGASNLPVRFFFENVSS